MENDSAHLHTGAESQWHGFAWEGSIKRNVFGVTTDRAYTDEYDIGLGDSPLFPDERVSIKVCASDEVGFADFARGMRQSLDGTPLTWFVVFYEHCDATNTKTATHVYDGPRPPHHVLYGDLTLEDVQTYASTYVKSIPHNRRPTKEEADAYKAAKKPLNARSGLMKIRPKCDSATSRVAAGFSGFKTWCRQNGTLMTYDDAVLARQFRNPQSRPFLRVLSAGRRKRHLRTVVDAPTAVDEREIAKKRLALASPDRGCPMALRIFDGITASKPSVDERGVQELHAHPWAQMYVDLVLKLATTSIGGEMEVEKT